MSYSSRIQCQTCKHIRTTSVVFDPTCDVCGGTVFERTDPPVVERTPPDSP